MRGKDNMQESRAHTHSTLGAIACSNLGSAPSPNGKRLAAIIKKKNTLIISERLRHATVISRINTRIINEGVLISVLIMQGLTANLA